MGRGTSVYLSYAAFVLLYAVSTKADNSIWTVDIDESPAPPRKDEPPFSKNAVRDRSVLPYQIIGVVGAYIASVLIVGFLLLTVGRSRRKKAQNMALQPKEMVKPMSKSFEKSPASPSENELRWYSPRRLRSKSSSLRSGPSTHASPEMGGAGGFDNTVLEADRLKRQREMERLYAAVLAQDEGRNGDRDPVTALPLSPDMPPEYSRKYPLNINTNDPNMRYVHGTDYAAGTPRTPKTPVRAIYPPDGSVPQGPVSPTSPIRAEYPPWAGPSHPEVRSDHRREQSLGSGKAPLSPASTSKSTPKKIRKAIRSLKISAPIPQDDNDDEAHTPLSPRFYADPGIPPEPPTGGTQRSPNFPPSPTSDDDYYYSPEDDEQIDQIRDLPHPQPQRTSPHNYLNQAQMVTDLASTRPDPTRSTNAGAVSNGHLPFRDMNHQYATSPHHIYQQYQQQQASSSSQQPAHSPPAASPPAMFPLRPSGTWNQAYAHPTSAGAVKTTFLEPRRDDRLAGMGSGVPMTPYSPYMPFTPVTPITPRLRTKAERKQKEKEEGKGKRLVFQEDAVVEEEELWSSAY